MEARTVPPHAGPPLAQQLILGAATRLGRDIQVAFTAFVQLRHHEGSTGTGRRQECPVRVHADREPTEDAPRVHRETWDRTTADGAVADDA